MKHRIIALAAAGGLFLTAAAGFGAICARQKAAGRYVLGEYGGRVAVYCPAEGSAPRRVTDIPVELLPRPDREQLRDGIAVGDGRELAMLLEDLGS